MNIYKKIAENAYRPFHRMKILNEDRLTIDSPTIFIINHQSTSEPLVVYRAIKEYSGVNPKFLAMSELFKTPLVKNFMVGLDFIPVYRNSVNAKNSLSSAIKYLNNGENSVIALYPEGEVSKDRKNLNVRVFKSGAARMALTNKNIKVIPVAQKGSSPGKIKFISNIFHRPIIKVKFGEAVNIPEELYNGEGESVKRLNSILEETVEKLYKEI